MRCDEVDAIIRFRPCKVGYIV